MIKCTLEYEDTLQIELEFGNVGFRGEGKTGVPGEKPLRARTRTKFGYINRVDKVNWPP